MGRVGSRIIRLRAPLAVVADLLNRYCIRSPEPLDNALSLSIPK